MTALGITLRYALFALIATLANLASQAVSLRTLEDPWALPASILVGTAVGLAVKYVLDKRWIFGFASRDWQHEGGTALRYTLTGIFTTLIFWGMELTFHFAFGTEAMRYLGGALGLAIGYLTKYRLDKKFVFTHPALASPGTDS